MHDHDRVIIKDARISNIKKKRNKKLPSETQERKKSNYFLTIIMVWNNRIKNV